MVLGVKFSQWRPRRQLFVEENERRKGEEWLFPAAAENHMTD